MDNSVPVIVLSPGRSLVQQGSLATIRTLGRLGISMYGVLDRRSPVARSRHLTNAYSYDMERGSTDELIGYLLDIGHSIGEKSILVCTDDLGLNLLDEH